MSSIVDIEQQQQQDPVAKLTLQPARSILKSSKSVDEARLDLGACTDSLSRHSSIAGMTRSESKSHKIPRFDEMNIIATYHPAGKDYGHMKIDEPKTPFNKPADVIDEEMDTEQNTSGVDAGALTDRLNESSPSYVPRLTRRSIDDTLPVTTEQLEHRQQFEHHRKQHYNEFEMARLHRKEIEAELRALEKDEPNVEGSPSH